MSFVVETRKQRVLDSDYVKLSYALGLAEKLDSLTEEHKKTVEAYEEAYDDLNKQFLETKERLDNIKKLLENLELTELEKTFIKEYRKLHLLCFDNDAIYKELHNKSQDPKFAGEPMANYMWFELAQKILEKFIVKLNIEALERELQK